MAKKREEKVDDQIGDDLGTPGTVRDSMDNLSKEEVLPDVSENAINAVTEKAQEEQKIVEEAEKANAKLNKDGSPAKKRGRKPKSEGGNFYNPRKPAEKEETKPGTMNVPSDYAAKVTSDIIENMSVNLVSKDFKYNELEKSTNIEAWKNTFDYYGGVDISPPMALALSHMGIIASRIGSSNETRSKLQLAKAWAANKFFKFRKRAKDARANNRSDTERKDNLGSKESQEPQKTA